MPEPEKLNLPPPGNDPLVAALVALKPSAADLNRDGLMYAAGAESRRGVVRLWQAAAGFLAAVGFAAGMFFRPGGYEKIVFVDRPVPSLVTTPEPRPVPEPEASQPAGPQTYRVPPQPKAYARAWQQFQADALSVGLSLLPDLGPTEKPHQQ